MRKTLLFLLLLSAKLAFGQFRDDFSDGNFTINPAWVGQTSLFAINSNKQLKSSLSTVAQTIMLATENTLALNCAWEFSVQLDFDPSTTNFTRVYLISDQADLKGSLNGYFIQIGESGGADSYDLYKQTGNTVLKIIDGLPKNRTNINFLSTKLRVTRDGMGRWEVFTSVDDGLTFSLEGSVIDKTFTSTNWFGVFCRYTATRSDGFGFDDFKVEELISDVTPPSLLSIRMEDEFTIEATFSETVTAATALFMPNYRLKGSGEIPISVQYTLLGNVVKLTFAQAFNSGPYTLIVNGISDAKGNTTKNSEASIFYIQPYIAIKGDVIINEIFADPSPTVGLPAGEFVELWNTTDKYMLLKDWKYKDLTTTYTFLTDTLRPNEYVILCATADEGLYKSFGKTMGLSNWPSLNNDQDKLSLISPQNVVVDEVAYTDNWYKEATKKNGGYSLELIDPNNKCLGVQNWQASNHDSGGTPGVQNVVYRLQLNSRLPKLIAAVMVDEITIRIDFDKNIDSLSGAVLGNYTLNNGIGSPTLATPLSPDFNVVLLKLSSPLTKGQEYLLTVNNISDCAGNFIDPTANTATLFTAKAIGEHDILISEILVNPKLGGVDFIEIYNATDHVLDLATLKLATIDAQGKIASVRSISSSNVHIPSKMYWVLTSDVEIVKQQYTVKNPLNMTKMASLPSYSNVGGTVILLSDTIEIDRFDYQEKMHFQLLQIVKGVSLERVSFQKPTNERGNFKSAAQASGFGTPTYQNSQEERFAPKNKVWLTAKVFSPDGDGVEDVLQVNYQLVDQDYVANVSIYNEKGLLVKKILKNTSIPKEGSFVWDGINDTGGLSKVGIYVIKFDVFALNGKVKSFEEVCVLGMKF